MHEPDYYDDRPDSSFEDAERFAIRAEAFAQALQAAAEFIKTKHVPGEYGYSSPSPDAEFLAERILEIRNPHA